MTLIIESTYEIMGNGRLPMAATTPLLEVETVDVLTLIDEYQGNGHEGTENELERLSHAIDGVLWAYGYMGRVIGGYHTHGGTLFTLDNDAMPSPAMAAAIRRRLDARVVKSCAGAVMVKWK